MSYKVKESDKNSFEVVIVKSNYKLNNIVGNDDVVKTLKDLSIQLKYSHIFESWGVPIPKGYILEGPPGSGKTLAVRCFADESRARMVELRYEDIASQYADKPSQLLAEFRAFVEEKASEGPIVVFIDEVENLFSSRSQSESRNHERQKVNFFLTWLDGGLIKSKFPIVFLATTNCINLVDTALTRSGRLSVLTFKHITSFEDQVKCFDAHISKISRASIKHHPVLLFEKIDYESIKDSMKGLTGADIAQVITLSLEIKALEHTSNILKKAKTVKETENQDISLDEIIEMIRNDSDLRPPPVSSQDIVDGINKLNQRKAKSIAKNKIGFGPEKN